MTRETKNNSHPEGGIYEQFAYTLKLSAYQKISDMKEISEIPAVALKKFINREISIVLWRC